MSKKFSLLALIAAFALTWVACGPNAEERKAMEMKRKADAAKAQMEAAREPMIAARAELDAARAELKAAEGYPKELVEKINGLEAKLFPLAGEFRKTANEYLAFSGAKPGETMTAEQRQVIDWMVDEQLLAAQEHIDKAGDYGKAIEIYDQILAGDMGNAKVEAAKASAEKLRYMDEARFALVQKGMTQKQVRATVGSVLRGSSQAYPDKGLIGWFYAKDADKYAGVYFKEQNRGQGDWVVSVTQWDVDVKIKKQP
jgi:hypothetical protein